VTYEDTYIAVHAAIYNERERIPQSLPLYITYIAQYMLLYIMRKTLCSALQRQGYEMRMFAAGQHPSADVGHTGTAKK
jgi:hypothetical protein